MFQEIQSLEIHIHQDRALHTTIVIPGLFKLTLQWLCIMQSVIEILLTIAKGIEVFPESPGYPKDNCLKTGDIFLHVIAHNSIPSM